MAYWLAAPGAVESPTWRGTDGARQRGMRVLAALLLTAATGCALDEDAAIPQAPAPLDVVWEQTIRRGDVVLLIPGTGSVDYLATPIEALGDHPIVDVRTNDLVRRAATANQARASNGDFEGRHRPTEDYCCSVCCAAPTVASRYVSSARTHEPIARVALDFVAYC